MPASLNSYWSLSLKQASRPLMNLKSCASWKSHTGHLHVKSSSPQTHATARLRSVPLLKRTEGKYHVIFMLSMWVCKLCKTSYTVLVWIITVTISESVIFPSGSPSDNLHSHVTHSNLHTTDCNFYWSSRSLLFCVLPFLPLQYISDVW